MASNEKGISPDLKRLCVPKVPRFRFNLASVPRFPLNFKWAVMICRNQTFKTFISGFYKVSFLSGYFTLFSLAMSIQGCNLR